MCLFINKYFSHLNIQIGFIFNHKSVPQDDDNSEDLDKQQIQENATTTFKTTKKTRTILWYLIFTGFVYDGMIRVYMSITIVDMVLQKDLNIITTNDIANTTIVNNNTLLASQLQHNRFSFERVILDKLNVIQI